MSEQQVPVETFGALCDCQHRVTWHHDTRGCQYLGNGPRQCPCALTSDEVCASRETATLARAEAAEVQVAAVEAVLARADAEAVRSDGEVPYAAPLAAIRAGRVTLGLPSRPDPDPMPEPASGSVVVTIDGRDVEFALLGVLRALLPWISSAAVEGYYGHTWADILRYAAENGTTVRVVAS